MDISPLCAHTPTPPNPPTHPPTQDETTRHFKQRGWEGQTRHNIFFLSFSSFSFSFLLSISLSRDDGRHPSSYLWCPFPFLLFSSSSKLRASDQLGKEGGGARQKHFGSIKLHQPPVFHDEDAVAVQDGFEPGLVGGWVGGWVGRWVVWVGWDGWRRKRRSEERVRAKTKERVGGGGGKRRDLRALPVGDGQDGAVHEFPSNGVLDELIGGLINAVVLIERGGWVSG